jgi:hypothetical protein
LAVVELFSFLLLPLVGILERKAFPFLFVVSCCYGA